MLEGIFRQRYQKYLVDNLAKKLGTLISPNLATVSGALVGIVSAVLLVTHHPYLASVTLILSGYLDSLDGTIARLTNQSTNFGSALDIICDRIVEFSIIFALYLINPIGRGTVAMLMMGTVLICVTSFLVVGIFTENQSHKSFHYSPGIMERFEAFVFFVAMILLPKYFNFLGIIFTILVIVTALIRMKDFAKHEH